MDDLSLALSRQTLSFLAAGDGMFEVDGARSEICSTNWLLGLLPHLEPNILFAEAVGHILAHL